MTHDLDSMSTVTAYVDGELDAPRRAAFEAALAADAQLQQSVQRQQALRAALREAYDPVLAEPVPAALQAALAPPRAARVFDFATAQAQRDAAVPAAPRAPRWGWPQWGAMAACVVAGVLLGRQGLPGLAPAAQPDLWTAAGSLRAGDRLAQALDDRLATDPAPADAISVGLSFQARDGRYCRSFALPGTAAAPGTPATAGLACRGSRHWEVVATAAAVNAAQEPAASAPGAYRTAATALPPALLAALDGLRAGDMLDAAGERAARSRRWQP
jgi:hypothetical protein